MMAMDVTQLSRDQDDSFVTKSQVVITEAMFVAFAAPALAFCFRVVDSMRMD